MNYTKITCEIKAEFIHPIDKKLRELIKPITEWEEFKKYLISLKNKYDIKFKFKVSYGDKDYLTGSKETVFKPISYKEIETLYERRTKNRL